MGLQVWLPLINDLSNQGLTNVVATNNGATLNTSGKIGGCYSFNGTNNYLSMPYNFYNNKYSVCAWVYTNSSTATQTIVCDRTSVGSGFSTFLIGGKLRVDCGGNNLQWTTSYSYPINTWFHVAITYDGGVVHYYINGEFKESKTQAIASTYWGNVTSVGASQANGSGYGNYLNGMLNDVRIYDHCLSPREVKEISKGLVLHYPMSQPGVANLHKNSATLSSWHLNQATLSNGVATITPTTSADRRIYQMPSEGGWSWQKDVQYTASIDARSDDGARLIIAPYGATSETSLITVTPQWERYSFTFTATQSGTSSMTYYCEQTSGVSLQLRHPKLEIGSVATPWIPNAADTEYTTMGFNDGIEYDVSGYSHNGTKTGTFAYDADSPRYNISTYFNGTNTRITPPIIFQSGSKMPEMTFAFWMKRNDYTDGKNHYIYNDICQIYTYTDYLLRISWRHDTASSSSGNTSAGSVAATTVTPNEWHHICYTFDKGYLRLYIDGEFAYGSDRTSTGQFMGTYNYQSIGYASGSNISYGGYLSDFRIYTTALSADDVMNLYHTPISLANNGTLLTQGEFVES